MIAAIPFLSSCNPTPSRRAKIGDVACFPPGPACKDVVCTQVPLTGVHMRHATSALAYSSGGYHCKLTRIVYCTGSTPHTRMPPSAHLYRTDKPINIIWSTWCRHAWKRRLHCFQCCLEESLNVSLASSRFNKHRSLKIIISTICGFVFGH